MAIGMRHQFIGFLCSGVQADLVVYIIVHIEWHIGVCAIDTGTAGVNQVLDIGMAASFQHVDKTDEITVNVGIRVDQ